MTPFFKRLFEKASYAGVQIVLPQDVEIAPRFIPKSIQEGDSRLTTGAKAEPKPDVHFEADAEHEAELRLFDEVPNIHWSDVAIRVGKSKIIDIGDQVNTRLSGYNTVFNSHANLRVASAPHHLPETADAQFLKVDESAAFLKS